MLIAPSQLTSELQRCSADGGQATPGGQASAFTVSKIPIVSRMLTAPSSLKSPGVRVHSGADGGAEGGVLGGADGGVDGAGAKGGDDGGGAGGIDGGGSGGVAGGDEGGLHESGIDGGADGGGGTQ